MADDDPDILGPADLGRKLVVALRSVSDPQAIMQAIADRTALNLRNELTTKIDGMDKAVVLWHDDLVRVPTEVTKAVSGLRELLEQVILKAKSEVHDELGSEIAKLCGEVIQANGRITTLTEVSEERFKSIQIQFTLLKQATEQLDLANKTAIAAALQAQKESAGETQKSSQAAIAKSETSTAEAIKALTQTFNVAIQGLTDRYNDLKSRFDRGEGRGSISDPAINTAIDNLKNEVRALNKSTDTSGGHAAAAKDNTATFIAIGALVVAVIVPFLMRAGGLH